MRKILFLILTSLSSWVYAQEEDSGGVFLNFNGSFGQFGLARQASAGVKIGAMPNENWLFGATLEYHKIEVTNGKVWELKVGPILRYYFIEENFRFFLGAQVAYSSYNTSLEPLPNPGSGVKIQKRVVEHLDILYYGPEGGISVPIIGKEVFIEFLVRHSWIAQTEELVEIEEGSGHLDYANGISLIL